MNKVVGIAGGSGAGKSTLCVNLCRKYPEKFCIMHLDDYFKKEEYVPMLDGFKNYDHPDALRFDDFLSDLSKLKSGEAIKLRSRGQLYNPEYGKSVKNKIEVEILPKPIILAEGYLVLYDERIRNLMDSKIFLDLPIEESLKRRVTAGKGTYDGEYYLKVLIPMHKEYVEPTRLFADKSIDVSNLSREEVASIFEGFINFGVDRC